MAEPGHRPEILMTALVCGAIAKSVDGIRGRPVLRETIEHLVDELPRDESTTLEGPPENVGSESAGYHKP